MNRRRVLITGAGSGIGQACALALLQAGWQVMLCGRNAAKLQATLGKAGPLAGNADWQVTDIRDADDVGRLFEHTRTRFGRLDLLFNNAGTSAPAVALEDLSPEQWQQVLDTNLTGAFAVARAAAAGMRGWWTAPTRCTRWCSTATSKPKETASGAGPSRSSRGHAS